MFKCEICHKITEPREKLTKYPVKFRDKVYQNNHPFKKNQVITSYGKEIVKEINVCEKCAEELKNGEIQ